MVVQFVLLTSFWTVWWIGVVAEFSFITHHNTGQVHNKRAIVHRPVNGGGNLQIPSKGLLLQRAVVGSLEADQNRLVLLRHDLNQTPYDCDFNSHKVCLWQLSRAAESIPQVTNTGADVLQEANDTRPRHDADGNRNGGYLLYSALRDESVLLSSPILAPLTKECKLQFWAYSSDVNATTILVILNYQEYSLPTHTGPFRKTEGPFKANRVNKWTKFTVPLRDLLRNFTISIEVRVQRDHETPESNLSVALDNIILDGCYAQTVPVCSVGDYLCKDSRMCIDATRICDIAQDCPLDDDEHQNCHLMPFGSRCNFEDDWCGWHNVEGHKLQWRRHNGSTPTHDTGPDHDHTYKNNTGKYLYVNMLNDDAQFASSGGLRSIIFNPPPRVHGNQSSQFFNSCNLRFYLHQTGKHKSGIMLHVTELRPTHNHSIEILWSFVNNADTWMRKVVTLPNITHRFFLTFEAKRGLRYISDIAIDDVTLSPECFGINIPANELGNYSYWNPNFDDQNSEVHPDFVNRTVYLITTCKAKGRFGPSQQECDESYKNTEVKVHLSSDVRKKGVQQWTVPFTDYYTFIVYGASGGLGSGAVGSSRGTMIRVVVELQEGNVVYSVVGQKGTDACVKTLGHQKNSSCSSDDSITLKGVRAVLNLDVTDGGGGGGGGTFVYMMNEDNKRVPIVVAAGGGGIGVGRFIDTGRQHGHGVNNTKEPVTGQMYDRRSAGAGGGWRMFAGLISPWHRDIMGGSLIDGNAIGGLACYSSTDGRGNGGFGGGGGGCRAGGGGGGYAGGDALAVSSSTSGEGGYSHIDPVRTVPEFSSVTEAYHAGFGQIQIIRAVTGCGCEHRCVALNAKMSHVGCICPRNWRLAADGKSCSFLDQSLLGFYPPQIVIFLVAAVVILIGIITAVCFVLYSRYQYRASGLWQRKVMPTADLQLNRLRVASDSMTEYNPNYEFGGTVYTAKDLKDIPREQLRLTKALGQGAFGEVYQGFYRHSANDTKELPVAVKTLPEMSTSQAEMDFLMEALIMSKFDHPHIVHFIGVCFDKHPRFIVLELLAGGDLKTFLRESRPKVDAAATLTIEELVLMAMDVAKGCMYLENSRFIHRDIAARNCLLTCKEAEGRVVKIADFGMSRDVYRSEYYRKGGKAMLPIKWMPPEAFLDGIFSSKTDVWSFGVLLWEIMSLGYMPYTGCANREVMELVTKGGRLDPPANCPAPIYGIMTQCWHPTPDQRPNFATILERLGYCLQDPIVTSTSLPVFDRTPSHETDTTIMRPESIEESKCIQIQQLPASDYMIPIDNNEHIRINKPCVDEAKSPFFEGSLPHSHNTSTKETVIGSTPMVQAPQILSSDDIIQHQPQLSATDLSSRQQYPPSAISGICLDARLLTTKYSKNCENVSDPSSKGNDIKSNASITNNIQNGTNTNSVTGRNQKPTN